VMMPFLNEESILRRLYDLPLVTNTMHAEVEM
jgi:hypothetical protein